jgi:N6-adenosine-specific RNA methylase IME4
VTSTFRAVSLDPPWPERGGGKSKRGADKHYPVQSVRDIYRIIATCEPFQRMAEDSHMYMWVTNNRLLDGGRIMGDLGYRYITNLCWPKGDVDQETGEIDLQTGIGQYFRGEHELLLFGVKGDGYAARTERRDLGTVLQGRRTKHSRKPPSTYERIEARSHGPYLEIFARDSRPGWTAWGNEAPCVSADSLK